MTLNGNTVKPLNKQTEPRNSPLFHMLLHGSRVLVSKLKQFIIVWRCLHISYNRSL